MPDKIVPIKTGNTEKDNQIDRITEVKQHEDVDVVSVIDGKAAEVEKIGFPTQSVKVPKIDAYVLVNKIGHLRRKLYESPYYVLATQGKVMLENTPGYDPDGDTTKMLPSPNNPKLTIYEEYVLIRDQIKDFQKQLDTRCVTYLFRGLPSDIYTEIPRNIAKKQAVLNKQRDKVDGDNDAELPYRDSFWVQLAASCIVCYKDGDTVVNQEDKTFEQWLDHFEQLDKYMQMGISERADENGAMVPFSITKCLSSLLLSARDFELAMMDLSF